MRRKVKNRNMPEADRVYNSVKLSKFINCLMWDGKKATAEGIAYKALDIIKEKTENPNPLEIFDLALKNTGPTMEVRSRRIGGANYQVPRGSSAQNADSLSLSRWMLEAARAKKGSNMEIRLADELIAASKGEGAAVKKRDDTHRMAEANKAFAHFAW
jgi:small subunit ribosomal protein S7